MDINKFKVLTLNCWGVFLPIVCEKRHERLAAIGDELSTGYYDIVLLQEIWTESDFEKLRTKLKKTYPFSNYFHSNLIGSGCCIFTKYKITNTFFYRFSLNGYPHSMHHGDWFGGKGIGMVTLEMSPKNFRINVYVTHLHARYEHKEEDDQYYFHRVVQGFETGEFIRLTSSSCDAVIVGGDLNMDESMIGFNFIAANSGVKDAWFNEHNPLKHSIEDAATCDRPDSPYRNRKWNQFYPNGERLDYIFYRQNSCIKLVCKHCSLQMRSVPGNELMHYSDHCGVEAHFEISQNPLETADEIDEGKRAELCNMSLEKLDAALCRIQKNYKMNIILFIVTLLCLLFDYPNAIITSIFGNEGIPGLINRLILSSLAMLCFIFFWYFTVIRTSERKAVLNAQQSMHLILDNSKKPPSSNSFGDEVKKFSPVKNKIL